MGKYLYEMVKNHIIFQLDKKSVLLDTGAPTSIGDSVFRFESNNYDLHNRFMGVSAGNISEHIGKGIDVLLGVDILKEFDLIIDPRDLMMNFGSRLDFEGRQMDLDIFMGIPILEIRVGGEPIRAFFDTGASVSYMDEELLVGLPVIREVEDFYPNLGHFTTQIHELKIAIDETSIPMEFGVLPQPLQMMLSMANARCILGTQVLRYFVCGLSLQRKMVCFKSYN